MEINDLSRADMHIPETREINGNEFRMQNLKLLVDEMFLKVDQLEHKMNEVEQFYLSANKKPQTTAKGNSAQKDKDKEKQISGFRKRQQDAARKEAAAAKRMQDLIRQFNLKIIGQLTQHRWAGPFMQPVDVVGLELHDYYEVIEKPMDFSTIRNKIEAKDGTGYKHVRELCADVRLIFKNAIKYNNERDDVHVMAKTLLAKFEEKWLQLLPKVDEEEKRRKEEETEVQMNIKLAQEAAHGKMARDLSIELDEVDMHLEELREMALQNCRKMSTEDKKRLGTALTQLSSEDLDKALLIVAQNNPSFEAHAEEVNLDMDAQSEATLWKLKLFVKDTLQMSKSPASVPANNTTSHNQNNNNNNSNNNNNNNNKNNSSNKNNNNNNKINSSNNKNNSNNINNKNNISKNNNNSNNNSNNKNNNNSNNNSNNKNNITNNNSNNNNNNSNNNNNNDNKRKRDICLARNPQKKTKKSSN